MSELPSSSIILMNLLNNIDLPNKRKLYHYDYKKAFKQFLYEMHNIGQEMYILKLQDKHALQNIYEQDSLINKFFTVLYFGNYEQPSTQNYLVQEEIRNYMKELDYQFNNEFNICVFQEMKAEYKLFKYNMTKVNSINESITYNQSTLPLSSSDKTNVTRLSQERLKNKISDKNEYSHQRG